MKKSPLSIGFLQALGITVYCVIISGFFLVMEKYMVTPPQFLGMVVMLILLVLSAAICGAIVFGYPCYLILKEERIREGLQTLGYFALFLLGIIIVSLVLISVFI